MRWLTEDVPFQNAYRRAREEVLRQAIAQLQAACGKAVATLCEVMEDPKAQSTARVGAARAILEMAFRGSEQESIEARIAALEQVSKVPTVQLAS